MERKTLGYLAPVMLGTLLSFLLSSKKTALTFSIEIVSGLATALYVTPYAVQYFNFPEGLTAFALGTASAKICRSIYDRFNSKEFNPVDIIINSPESETQEVLKETSNNV